MHDTGIIEGEAGGSFVFKVEEAEKIGDAIIHKGFFKQGSLPCGQDKDIPVKVSIDMGRRMALARAHTATHLLQASLRKILGLHIQQQGSLVDEDYFRFDFSHFKGLTDNEIVLIEEQVNNYITEDLDVERLKLSLEEAKKQQALAFFEERYEQEVTMVKISDVSKELCGGTHLSRTQQAGLFVIISESAVSSGIRRIEALTGRKAYDFIKEKIQKLKRLSLMLKTPQANIEQALESLILSQKQQARTIQALRRNMFEKAEADYILKKGCVLKGAHSLVIFELKDASVDFLRSALDILKSRVSANYILIGYLKDKDKLTINMTVTGDLVEKGFSCKKACLDIARRFGGSGGGRDDFGFAGAKNPEGVSLDKMKKIATEVIEGMLKF